MERNQLIDVLAKTIKAIQEYRTQPLEKISGAKLLNERAENAALDVVRGQLIKEAYMIGLSGTTCPACNGTGRMSF